MSVVYGIVENAIKVRDVLNKPLIIYSIPLDSIIMMSMPSGPHRWPTLEYYSSYSGTSTLKQKNRNEEHV